MTATAGDPLAEGHAALRQGDTAAARRAFAAAEDPTGARVVEGLARAAYIDLDFDAAIAEWEQAYAAYRRAGDAVGASRCARTLAYMSGSIRGDGAVMSGWLSRATTLLEDVPDTAERGWVALNRGMFAGDRNERDALFGDALHAGRRFGDDDLSFVALAYRGANLVHADRVAEGMALLDEACAAVAGHDVDDFCALQEIFCQLFSACEYAHDVARADQWIRIGESIAARRRLPAVSAFCRTHYGGLLTDAGRWPEADEALTEAVRLWGLGHRSMQIGARVRLADLRIRQGQLEEAEAVLAGIDGEGEAARPIAAIHLARGDTPRARDILERALAAVPGSSSSIAPLLSLLVDVHLAEGEHDEAGASARRLVECGRTHGSDFVLALAARANGKVCLATSVGDPGACLREALAAFGRARMPIESARVRLALAEALRDTQPALATTEARTAMDEFLRLDAGRDVDAAAAVLRSLGVRAAAAPSTAGGLTRRESEVLELLARGLSNPEISDRLYISRKTVEHHVGNVLSKLGLRTRGEAAAHVRRSNAGGE
ncbi:MAG TPA: LuxR C-terminal-related transcriptional regulator [Acidimicrobiales bacterium]|nr:LuxR C-terminal-related transcriptional regulator [Acidimicrobiales bacterium]